ncbi:WD domain, G-beta repeat [Pirellula sp. SH-Sr6A]|uniref:WD40 repeat domain-containing protein n=1 Tax=Pirellula sp. SH-Sr6A TaxID=1632865 RepID=UPI00078EBAF0|nr:hypothetical protein [Pirellula sp. SH-Sr6A]AMV33537.1 WD domain, G-beta repeat [Pirellula sp. SH-Sr6A]
MSIELTRTRRIQFPMGILDIAVEEDSGSVFTACMDGIYRCEIPVETDGPKPKPIRIGSHASYVSSIAIRKSSKSLITAAYDGTLHVRSMDPSPSQTELPLSLEKKIHPFWSWDMAMSPDEKWVASVTGQYLAGSEKYEPLPSEEPTVRVFDAATGETVHAMHMLPSVQCVAIDASSRFVAAGNLMGDLAVWELTTGKELARWRTPAFSSWGVIKSHCYIGGIYAVSFSPDSETLYAAGMGEMVDPMAGNGKQRWQKFAWRANPVEKVAESKDDQTGEGLMETLAWNPQGHLFVMAGRLRGGNWNLGVFDGKSGELIGQAKTGMRITQARFSRDGATLYLAGMQGQPQPKDGKFPDFGYLETYALKQPVT